MRARARGGGGGGGGVEAELHFIVLPSPAPPPYPPPHTRHAVLHEQRDMRVQPVGKLEAGAHLHPWLGRQCKIMVESAPTPG